MGTRSVTRKLEALKIRGGCLSGNEDAIRRNSPNLKRIFMGGRGVEDRHHLSRFIALYGEQLRYAYLRDLGEQQVLRIATACNNARFYLEDYRMGVSAAAAAFTVLGDRLEEINISGFDVQDSYDPQWTNAWDKCTHLRKLSILDCDLHDVEAVFATPKEHLKDLYIDIKEDMAEESLKNLMDTVAKGTTCVDKFVYENGLFCGRPFYRDPAHKFFDKNRRSLTSITVNAE